LAIAVGVVGFLSNLAIALTAALIVWWGVNAILTLRARAKA
jgi:hypothetical protein